MQEAHYLGVFNQLRDREQPGPQILHIIIQPSREVECLHKLFVAVVDLLIHFPLCNMHGQKNYNMGGGWSQTCIPSVGLSYL